MSIFIDTSAFVSILDAGDENHQKARKKWEEMISEESILVCSRSKSIRQILDK